MLSNIVAKLKTGTYKNVIAFGDTKPSPPYVVVKDSDFIGAGKKAFIIIPHMLTGQRQFLEDYINVEVPTLLKDFSAISRYGNLQFLYQDLIQTPPVLITNNDDGSISMERVFWMPYIN